MADIELYVKLQFLHKRIKKIEENHSFRKGTCKISVNKANKCAKFIEIVSFFARNAKYESFLIKTILNQFAYCFQYMDTYMQLFPLLFCCNLYLYNSVFHDSPEQ